MLEYDSKHMYIDDENVYHFAAASSKQGEYTFRIEDEKVYVFKGIGSSAFDCIPSTIASDRDSKTPTNFDQYKLAVSQVAEHVATCKLLDVDIK